MKMIGVCSERARRRIIAAVSKPSMPGMRTSSRITAKSRWRSSRSAALPELALTISVGSSRRMDSSAISFSGLSSTIRTLASSGIARSSPVQPDPQQREQLLGVDRLRDVVGGARLDALLAVALHRLGGDGDDRQVLEPAR